MVDAEQNNTILIWDSRTADMSSAIDLMLRINQELEMARYSTEYQTFLVPKTWLTRQTDGGRDPSC